LVFECEINFSNIIGNAKVIIIFLAKFFDVMLTVEEKGIAKILNARISNLGVGIKFAILNNFAIVLWLS